MIDNQPIPMYPQIKLHPSAALTAFEGAFIETIDSAEAAHTHNETAGVVSLRERAGHKRLYRKLLSMRRDVAAITAEDVDRCIGLLARIVESDDLEDWHRDRNDEHVQRIKLTGRRGVLQVEAQLGAKLQAAQEIERSLIGHDQAAD